MVPASDFHVTAADQDVSDSQDALITCSTPEWAIEGSSFFTQVDQAAEGNSGGELGQAAYGTDLYTFEQTYNEDESDDDSDDESDDEAYFSALPLHLSRPRSTDKKRKRDASPEPWSNRHKKNRPEQKNAVEVTQKQEHQSRYQAKPSAANKRKRDESPVHNEGPKKKKTMTQE
jgi:hypothetical protein